MNKKQCGTYSFFMICMLAATLTVPVFGEGINQITESVKMAGFIDINKDPQHYLDRYYGEPTYKAWFDRNYPDITIEEAVGLESATDESSTVKKFDENIIPQAEAVSEIESDNSKDNSDIALMVLAVGGLGILFGAVLGIKKQVDTNSRQISINKDTIKKKIINQLMGLKPVEILQTRLAKGELTVQEFEELERRLKKDQP